MKFTKEHYEALKDCVSSVSIKSFKSNLEALKNNEISNRKFIWNIYWLSQFDSNHRDIIGLYLDDHIETATKTAIKELISIDVLYLINNI